MLKQKQSDFREWVDDNGFSEGDLRSIQRSLGMRTVLWFFLGFSILPLPFLVETWAWYKRVKQRTFRPKPGIVWSLCCLIMFFYMVVPLILFLIPSVRTCGEESGVLLVISLVMWFGWLLVRRTTIGTGLRRFITGKSDNTSTTEGDSVNKDDPNTWTGSYVSRNKAECLRFLWEINYLVVNGVRQKNYFAAIAGLDRILNGLVTMQNAKCGDFRSHIAMLSMCEGMIIVGGSFGAEASESKRRETTIELFEDARDFSRSEQTRQSIREMIAELKSGTSLTLIREQYGSEFPGAVIDILTDLNNKLFA